MNIGIPPFVPRDLLDDVIFTFTFLPSCFFISHGGKAASSFPLREDRRQTWRLLLQKL